MLKTYKLTQPLRNSSFVLRGKSGNALRYNFSGGDPLAGKAATLMLRTQYAQELLEQSDLFKQGYVKLAKVDGKVENTEGDKVQNVVEDVTTPEQLITFVATELEKTYQSPKFALEFAKKQGYTFPNLTLE